jgi:hypothetical protein
VARAEYPDHADEVRVRLWRDHVGPDPSPDTLVDEALGHAVALRDELAQKGQDPTRALHLVDVLNALQTRLRDAADS